MLREMRECGWLKKNNNNKINIKKMDIFTQIAHLGTLGEQGIIAQQKLDDRSRLRIPCLKWLSVSKRIMNQKCKIKWLKEGSENNFFFQRWASSRKNKSFISTFENDHRHLCLLLIKELKMFSKSLHNMMNVLQWMELIGIPLIDKVVLSWKNPSMRRRFVWGIRTWVTLICRAKWQMSFIKTYCNIFMLD